MEQIFYLWFSLAMDRCAEPTTQLGIDEFILDYLIYMAIKDLLEESKAIISSNTDNSIRLDKKVELPLKMVDCGFVLNAYYLENIAHPIV